MDTKDARKVIENLQTRPYVCSENAIQLDNGYVIVKKQYFEELLYYAIPHLEANEAE